MKFRLTANVVFAALDEVDAKSVIVDYLTDLYNGVENHTMDDGYFFISEEE